MPQPSPCSATRTSPRAGGGGFALDRRDYARAAEAHRQLLRLEPENTPAWLRLAGALARLQRWAEAKDALARARSLDPKAPVAPELVAFLEQRAAAPGAAAR